MNRTELQQLSDERVADAGALLAAQRWSGAYYLAGYALECALKSCVLAYVDSTGVIFRDKKYAEKCWTHDIEELVRLADLAGERGTAVAANPRLGQNWLVVKDWSEACRYRTATELQAQKLYDALTERTDGVLTWVKTFW